MIVESQLKAGLLADAIEAMRYQGEGHPRGKVVVTVAS